MRQTNTQYKGSQSQFEDITPAPSLGGIILQFKAGGTLNVGDVVQLTGTVTVNKLAATPNRTIGVVVGGQSMPDGGVYQSTSTQAADAALITAGIVAATVNQYVLVLVQGIAYVVADAAIANAAQIKASVTVAGRVSPAVSALTIAAGGVAVTSTAANGAIISGDDAVGHVIGKLIDAAAAANGDVRLAYISIH